MINDELYARLTADEKKWLKKMQRVLDECPSTLAFFTIGDPYLQVYDRCKEAAIMGKMDANNNMDFCTAVDLVRK